MEQKFSGLMLLILLFFVSEEAMMQKSEAKRCYYINHHYRGLCIFSSNCNKFCIPRNFEGGLCTNFDCVCFRECPHDHSPTPLGV
ncbi:hypothetical protein LOK49_Contig181G00007 [Camellia lanceoleosa]|nr:hypothetical protein LOK49_Contig181G00007 [Camellia lanceoleosa]